MNITRELADQQIVQRCVALLQWRSNVRRRPDGRPSMGVAKIEMELAGDQDE
jgi:hypothetical protein